MRPNIQRHLAAAKKGSQASQAPGQEPGGPTLAGKRDWGPVGGSSELKEGGCLVVMGHALEKPVRSCSEAASGAPCTRALCLLFSPKKDKKQD